LKIPNRPRFDCRELAGGIAYIGLNTFNDPAIDSDFEAKFNELRRAKSWIIDLRYNGGGSSGIGYAILAHFIDAPVEGSRQSTRLYNPTLAARNQAQPWYDWETDTVAPAAEPRYRGPVYVLTSPWTCSAAEDFLIPVRAAKRVTIVGEPSCGSTGQPLEFSIYGATARVCTKWDRFPDGTEFVGVGVVPDIKAAPTKEDVAAGRDAVLETALRLASR
jgi:C-terminal processing protease CtpA/Prc